MDKVWKSKWLEALRSEKYKQGKSVLRDTNNNFCCLGVLCDLVDPSGWGQRHGDAIPYKNDHFSLPREIAVKVGIRDGYGSWKSGEKCLATENDNGKSFSEIANIIEKYF